jgi:hypothetical protein
VKALPCLDVLYLTDKEPRYKIPNHIICCGFFKQDSQSGAFMKKGLMGAVILSISGYCYSGMWMLVNKQFSVNKWYCTYKLDGTTVTRTIQSNMPCQRAIFEN